MRTNDGREARWTVRANRPRQSLADLGIGLPPVHRVAAAATVFWLAVLMLQKLNWFGVYKAALLGALLFTVPVLLGVFRRQASVGGDAALGLTLALVAAIVAQIAYFGVHVVHPHLIDIATTTLNAGAAILRGQNPYVLPIDEVAGGLSDTAFHGYKYMPVMAIAYLPLGVPFGERGVLITNLLLHFGVAWTVWRLALRGGTTASGQLAVLLYLSLPLVAMQVLAKGSTDLVAVLPLLLALLCLEESAIAAGVCVGLSICAKLLPGMVFVPCLLPSTRADRLGYGLGIGIGLVPALPFVLWSPAAIADNVVLFTVLRPPDATSWVAAVPRDAILVARLIGALVVLGVAVAVWRRPPSAIRRCGFGAILALVVILAGGSAHHNYQLWWLPFYCVLLAVAVIPADPRCSSMPMPRKVRPAGDDANSARCHSRQCHRLVAAIIAVTITVAIFWRSRTSSLGDVGLRRRGFDDGTHRQKSETRHALRRRAVSADEPTLLFKARRNSADRPLSDPRRSHFAPARLVCDQHTLRNEDSL